MTSDPCVGMLILFGKAPAAAGHTAFREAMLSLWPQGRVKGWEGEHWDLPRWEIKDLLLSSSVWQLNLEWLKKATVGSTKNWLAVEPMFKAEEPAALFVEGFLVSSLGLLHFSFGGRGCFFWNGCLISVLLTQAYYLLCILLLTVDIDWYQQYTHFIDIKIPIFLKQPNVSF